MGAIKLRNARKLALQVVLYFGNGRIQDFLDGDIELRDRALEFLGFSKCAGKEISNEVWTKIIKEMREKNEGK